MQAPHVNVPVFGRGLLKGLSTRVYFADDPANQDDPILALVPQDRRATLLARQDSQLLLACGALTFVFPAMEKQFSSMSNLGSDV